MFHSIVQTIKTVQHRSKNIALYEKLLVAITLVKLYLFQRNSQEKSNFSITSLQECVQIFSSFGKL